MDIDSIGPAAVEAGVDVEAAGIGYVDSESACIVAAAHVVAGARSWAGPSYHLFSAAGDAWDGPLCPVSVAVATAVA